MCMKCAKLLIFKFLKVRFDSSVDTHNDKLVKHVFHIWSFFLVCYMLYVLMSVCLSVFFICTVFLAVFMGHNYVA